jgi:hypothetical protein
MLDGAIDILNLGAGAFAIAYGYWRWRRYHLKDDLLWCATGLLVICIITFSFITRYLLHVSASTELALWHARQLLEWLGLFAWLALGYWFYIACH